jgi:hypothetical protein
VVVAEEFAERAEQLIGLWSALSMQHVALGAACACGMGGISLRLDDFELDIVDYLEDAAMRSGIAEVVSCFTARQTQRSQSRPLGRPGRVPARPLVDLLEDLHNGRLGAAVAQWVLPKIETTLRSYEEQHGRRASP